MLSPDYNTLIEEVQRAIRLAPTRGDMKPLRVMATKLSGALISEFDEVQKLAHETALRFQQADADESMQTAQLASLAKRLDGRDTTIELSRQEQVDRLLFAALNTQTPFDEYGAHFLLDLSFQLGLSCDRVRQAFSEFVEFGVE
jgi:hypothetical protein